MTMSSNDNTIDQNESSFNDLLITDLVDKQRHNLVKLIDQIHTQNIQSIFSKLKTGGFKLENPFILKMLTNLPDLEDLKKVGLESEHTRVYIKAYQQILEPIEL